MLSADVTVMGRYDPDGAAMIAGAWASTGVAVSIPVDGRVELG
ncbi:MAG: hypothetical protein JWP68_851, partial [Modestobacter sp.]|nr:hypothetical protein [Modestobacter sp.]